MGGGIGAVKAEAWLVGLVERKRAGLGPLLCSLLSFFSFFFKDFSYFNSEFIKKKKKKTDAKRHRFSRSTDSTN